MASRLKPGLRRSMRERVAGVAAEVVNPAEHVDVLRAFPRQGRVAEARDGSTPRLVWTHAAANELVGSLVEMKAAFLVEIVRSLAERAAQTLNPSHDSSSSGEAQNPADAFREAIPSDPLFVEALLARARQL